MHSRKQRHDARTGRSSSVAERCQIGSELVGVDFFLESKRGPAMPSYDARIIPSRSIPNAPIREHCSARRSQITTTGRNQGQQVRIRYAPEILNRRTTTCGAAWDSPVRILTREQGGFVERLTDNGRHRGLIVIAPHGGDIERHTDEQAEHVGNQLSSKCVSVWVCKGLDF